MQRFFFFFFSFTFNRKFNVFLHVIIILSQSFAKLIPRVYNIHYLRFQFDVKITGLKILHAQLNFRTQFDQFWSHHKLSSPPFQSIFTEFTYSGNYNDSNNEKNKNEAPVRFRSVHIFGCAAQKPIKPNRNINRNDNFICLLFINCVKRTILIVNAKNAADCLYGIHMRQLLLWQAFTLNIPRWLGWETARECGKEIATPFVYLWHFSFK